MKGTFSFALTLLGLTQAFPSLLQQAESNPAKRIDGAEYRKLKRQDQSNVPFDAALVSHLTSLRMPSVTDLITAIG